MQAAPDGSIWFTTWPDHEIGFAPYLGKIAPDGSIAVHPVSDTDGSGPTSIGLGPKGRIWVGFFHGDVGKVTLQGQRVIVRHSKYDAPVYGITAGPNGKIWFGVFENGVLGRMSFDGKGLTYFDIAKHAAHNPAAVVAGPGGTIYFSGSVEIVAVRRDGVIAGDYALPGFNSFLPTMTVGSDGNLWVANPTGGQIAALSLR